MPGKSSLLFGLLVKIILERTVNITTSALLKGKASVASLFVDVVRYVEMIVINFFYDDKIYTKDHLNIYILIAATLFLLFLLFTPFHRRRYLSSTLTRKSPLDHLAL